MNPKFSLFNCFDQSYIINLPERSDRRQDMRQELKRLGLSELSERVKFFPAIKPTDPDNFPSIGARGCFLSHLEILKQAKAQNLSNLLIMEDDLSFSRFLTEREDEIMNELHCSDWDIAYLGHCADLVPGEGGIFRRYFESLRQSHFIAFNKQAIAQMVDFLEKLLSRPAGHPDGGPMHVDGAYSTFRRQNPGVITLVASPSLGFQRPSPSNIAGYKWFDKLPVLSRLTMGARKVKTWHRQNAKA